MPLETGVKQEESELIKKSSDKEKAAVESFPDDSQLQNETREVMGNSTIKVDQNLNKKKLPNYRIKNWTITMTVVQEILNSVIEGLQNSDEVLRFEKWATNAKEGPCSYLQLEITFIKQITETAVRKILKTFMTPDESINSIIPTKKQGNTNKTTAAEEMAKRLILKMGMPQAEIEYAKLELPRKIFYKTLEDIEWRQSLKQKEQRRLEAEKQKKSFYPWQKYLAEELLEKPSNDRTVWCVLDEKGCTGKSYFQRVIGDLLGEDAVLMMPSASNHDTLFIAAKKATYKIVILNISRQSKAENFGALERIKDGIVHSTKYSGKYVRTEPPHVVLFSNHPLKWNSLTEDRWKILHIKREADKEDSFEIFCLSQYKNSIKNNKPP